MASKHSKGFATYFKRSVHNLTSKVVLICRQSQRGAIQHLKQYLLSERTASTLTPRIFHSRRQKLPCWKNRGNKLQHKHGLPEEATVSNAQWSGPSWRWYTAVHQRVRPPKLNSTRSSRKVLRRRTHVIMRELPSQQEQPWRQMEWHHTQVFSNPAWPRSEQPARRNITFIMYLKESDERKCIQVTTPNVHIGEADSPKHLCQETNFTCMCAVYSRVGQTASLRTCMRLSELSEKWYICFSFFNSIAECRNIVKWYCGSSRAVQYYFCKTFQKELWCHRSVDCK